MWESRRRAYTYMQTASFVVKAKCNRVANFLWTKKGELVNVQLPNFARCEGLT